MPRPRKNAELLPYEGAESVFEVVEPESQRKTAHDEMLDDILEDLSNTAADNVLMYIYRQSSLGGNKPMSQLEVCPVDKFTAPELFVYLRDNYGAGDYRIHIKRGREFLANKLITIETPNKPALTKSTLGETGDLLQALLDRQDKQYQVMLDLIAEQRNPQGSKAEWYKEMLLIRDLFGAQQSGGGIGELKQAIELLTTLGFTNQNAQPQEEGFGALLEKMTPVITAAINQPKAPPIQPMQPAQPAPQANQMQIVIKAGIMQLLTAAKKNSDPGIYAQLVLDALPAEAIQKFITSPDALTNLKRFHPAIETYAPWFIDLGEHVKALLGMPSAVSDLYDDEEPAINEESSKIEQTPDSNDRLHD